MDLKGWMYRCEQFFQIDGTGENAKVKLATVRLEGKALQWHQVYMKSRVICSSPTCRDANGRIWGREPRSVSRPD